MFFSKKVNTSINSVDVSISEKCYVNKVTDWANVIYHREHLTINELSEKLREGHCVCHCFKTANDTFSIREKTNANFEKADMIFVDVDDCDIEMNLFVSLLTNKPTIFYTTPSNYTAKSNWLYRFRLVYVLDAPITDKDTYKQAYNHLMGCIVNDIPSFVCKDNCGGVASQQFGGNGNPSCDMQVNDTVFSLSQIPFLPDNAPSSSSTYRVEIEKTVKNKYDITDKEFISDFGRMETSDFIIKYRMRYSFFDCSKLNYNEGYALIPDDYRCIYRKWYIDSFIKNDGQEVKYSRIRKVHDGEGRRKKLYIGALVRKQIDPNISFEHLLYCLVVERHYFFDNCDRVLTNKVLASIADKVVKTPVEDIKIDSTPHGRRKFKYKVDKAYCAEHDISVKTMRNKVRKILKDAEIGSAYDCLKTVAENLAMFKEMGIKVGKAKLYAWCKENGVPTKPKPMMQSPFLFVPTVEVDTKKQEPYSSIVASASCVNSSFVSI